MIEIESVKIKIGKAVVEVTKDDADLAKLIEAIGEKPPVYIPYYPQCPSVWTHYPEWTL